MRYKTRLILIVLAFCIISCGATRGERVNSADTSGMQKMHTTAYCLHGVTANGGTTRPHIAACNPRLGQIAVIYSLDGKYLYTAEITDKGTTNGLIAGTVIDVWFDTYEECEEWMRTTGGRCYVLWMDGKG